MSSTEEETRQFIERFAAELTDAGMQRMAARVFTALLASENGALTSAELGERLTISPAAVSGAIRYLSQVGMVSRETDPGSRRERYRVRADQWFQTFAARDLTLKRWVSILADGVQAVGRDTPAGHRVAETQQFMTFLQAEMGTLMDRWTARREELVAEGKL
ncbi:MarR family transcriptional regulator [Streptomyces sp. NPDC051940]|uniref:GbsR/MarR family transcriptional regulator n=1 Tax=Streptomyces sp. NPDC051940 TaxID=3155675 RepID=UPI00343544F6